MQPQQKNIVKINNSYESDPSGSGSSLSEHNEACEDENINYPYLLKMSAYENDSKVVNSDQQLLMKCSDYDDQLQRYDTPGHLSQQSSFEGFSESSYGQVKNRLYGSKSQPTIRAPTPPKIPLMSNIYDTIVEENSCNAVDLQLPAINSVTSNYVSSQLLSFDGRIKSLTQESNISAPTPAVHIPPTSIVPVQLDESFQSESKRIETTVALKKYCNEKSPDLFGDDDETDDENITHGNEDENAGVQKIDCSNRFADVLTDQQEKVDSQSNRSLNYTADFNFADVTCDGNTSMEGTKSYFVRENYRRERELLRRIRKCLAGIPPPPSLTIPQMDMFDTVLSNKTNILDYLTSTTSEEVSEVQGNQTSSLFKPTHTLEEAKTIPWNDIKGVRYHGLCLNLNKASEHSEYLSLSVIERFIGSETASSYHNITTPSSAKKRNNRLKLLTKSPGNRLSHLAKRRAIFSSANLATTSQKSLGPQILIDKKKSKHRRKATPKRKTPGSKRKNRKTPSSSARKRLSFRCDIRQPFPSRETSKRALFQSPAKHTDSNVLQLTQKLSIKPEIANRVEKSKRALFSPDKFATNSSTTSTSIRSITSDTLKLETLLKRKRNPIDDEDVAIELSAHSSKLFRGSAENLTPRALKIKSQSFCIGAGSSSATTFNATMPAIEVGSSSVSQSRTFGGSNSSLSTIIGTTKMQRAHSDMVMQTNSLTENQRKKLLWAVSQALQERKITGKHENFKQYASILARVVRRIFQEYYQKGSTSNSETMLRLAKKYAYNVVSGKEADDVYLQAKSHIEEAKRQCCTRLTGYIGPEEYQQLKMSQQSNASTRTQTSLSGSISNLFTSETSLDALSTSIGINQTSSSAVSVTATSGSSLVIHTTQDQQYTDTLCKTIERLPVQTNPALEHSSSKNNLGVLVLRENIDCEQRRSAQKNFTGKDQRNLSPYFVGGGSGVKVQSQLQITETNSAKAKRQITFDS